jgi:hypothetical protein
MLKPELSNRKIPQIGLIISEKCFFLPVRILSDQDPSGSAGATRTRAEAGGVGQGEYTGDSIRMGRVAIDKNTLYVPDQHLLDGR